MINDNAIIIVSDIDDNTITLRRFCGFKTPKGVLDLKKGSSRVQEVMVTMRSDYTVLWRAMRRGFKLRYRAVS